MPHPHPRCTAAHRLATLAAATAGLAAMVAPATVAAQTTQRPPDTRPSSPAASSPLATFGTRAELVSYFTRLTAERRREVRAAWAEEQRERARWARTGGARHGRGRAAGAAAPATRAAAEAAPSPAPTPSTPGAAAGAAASITNNQVQGVDEGDIVKAHGDHLVILRRGRLFSVRVGGGPNAAPVPVSAVDAFAPGGLPADWYDEMLVHGDTVIVVGYSYRAGGTEVGLFDIDAQGRLRFRSTMFVRSDDYYSSRNYATRVVGDQLVLYMPVPLANETERDITLQLPAVRYGRTQPWAPVLDYARLYRPVQPVGDTPLVHTVMTCDLRARTPPCRAEGIIGPESRTFYVSGSAVYLWTTNPDAGAVIGPNEQLGPNALRTGGAAVYRLPLTPGAQPGVMRASGAPVDQFSFHDDGTELHVMVRAGGRGDAMWAPESTAGATAALRVPVRGFEGRVGEVPAAAYTALPDPGRGMIQNRFVGTRLLFGEGSTWVRAASQQIARPVFVYDLAARRTTRVELAHGIDRIEPLGRDAVAVGTDGRNLHFTSLALEDRPAIAGHFVRANASQGETRSHGFFFRPDGDREGVLGLPITGGDARGYEQLRTGSAAVAFLRVSALRFSALGELAASQAAASRADRCVVSCVDWYGNARPIFYRGRVFALMGYELVEGRVGTQGVQEVARVDYIRPLLARLPVHRGRGFEDAESDE